MRSSEFFALACTSPGNPNPDGKSETSRVSSLTGTADEARSVNTLFDSGTLRAVGPAR
ncbi:hypothetical protein HMPREF9601_00883 [Cutibacterium acnes HL030PA1]|nr:hypothetical protein HMPREF9587_01272 [Cutibacterium acnes HL025PA1]EFT78918.1 hypothetical protein HMPREF9601_00883 [Cutibacterium acnes HL030PA1]MDU2317168.1 hypothetical protein [Cutibacterium acnes]GAE78365.1 hypothetical protein JCM18918_4330 [Cutibacterium acnes JCM 18918]